MKIIRNTLIPFGDYSAINLFGLLFVKPDTIITPVLVNHESIHSAQIREFLLIPFYIIYCLEWLFRLFQNKCDLYKAYREISFEKEAYRHQSDLSYLNKRKRFAAWRTSQ